MHHLFQVHNLKSRNEETKMHSLETLQRLLPKSNIFYELEDVKYSLSLMFLQLLIP